MIERRPFNKLGGEDHGWLKAKHHFSFADYVDPARIGWGSPPAREHGNHHLCP
jgi:hypothetical protein